MAGTGAPERPLRADAVRNRAKILTAAAEVFADRGLDVTLDDIAHHAGLGVGTVYRRFADREELIEALFDERMQATIVQMKAGLQAPDAWLALIGVIRKVCESFAIDRGLRQVMLSSAHGQDQVARCRIEIRELVEQLVERAKETGRLRPDFEATDIPIMFLMIGAVVDFAGAVQPDLWRRYLDVLIDGLQASRLDSVDLGDDRLTLDVTTLTLSTQTSASPPQISVLSKPTSALSDLELMAAMQLWRPLTLR